MGNSVWSGIGFALLLMLVFLLYALAIAAVVWGLRKLFKRVGVVPRAGRDYGAAQSPIGSASIIDPRRARKRPLAFAIALLSGVASIVGVFLYFIYPNIVDYSDQMLALTMVGLGLMVVGAVIAGVTFGTHDREYYL